MTGRSDTERTVKFDPVHLQIRNGGFEERNANGGVAEWYYQLQMKLNETDAPEGHSCVEFRKRRAGTAVACPASDGGRRIAGRRPEI